MSYRRSVTIFLWSALLLSTVANAQEPSATATSAVSAAPTEEPVPNTAALPDENATPMPVAAPPQECVPSCREGYACLQGTCVYACNPVCAPGYGCLSNGSCVPMPGSAQPAQIIYVDQHAALRQQQAQQEQLARAAAAAERKEYRTSPRFTLHLQTSLLGFWDADVFGWGGTLGFGFRKNFTDFFGLAARFNTTLGVLQLSYYDDYYYDTYYDDSYSRDAFFTAIDGEVIPYFGPFGRFYFGPILFVGGFWFDEEELSFDFGNLAVSSTVESGFMGGAGFDMGVLLGSREQIDINWRFKSAFFTDDMPFMLQIGVAVHFMKSK